MDIETSAIISQRAMIVNPAVKQTTADQARTQKSTDTDTKNNAPIAIRRDVDERIYAQAERFAQEQNTFYDQPNRHSRMRCMLTNKSNLNRMKKTKFG